MDNMIDIVARAIRVEEAKIAIGDQRRVHRLARAVITAMRQPTQHMCDRGTDRADARHTWETMIDAALSD